MLKQSTTPHFSPHFLKFQGVVRLIKIGGLYRLSNKELATKETLDNPIASPAINGGN